MKGRISTKGWELEVECWGDTSSLIPLKDLKESNPLKMIEYAISLDIHLDSG